MDQPEFLRGDQRFQCLDGQLAEIEPSQRSPLDELIKGLAADQLHHHIRSIFIGPDIINGDDVRVLE